MSDLRASADAVVLAAFPGPVLPDWARMRLEQGLAGVCLFGSNIAGPHDPDQLVALTSSIHEAQPTAIVTLDEEGGDVTRLYAATGSPYPGNAALGAVDDVEVTRRLAASIGAELATAGVDLNLAPSVDVNSDPRNPVIGVRSFSADPDVVARHGVAFVHGMQSAGVAACAKHFPGHGDTAEDSHVALPVVHADELTLRTRELPPFAAAIAAGAAAVMTSHVLLPAFDSSPATFSRRILTDLLKSELRFDGVIVSDALDMDGAWRWAGGIPEAAVASLVAGADLLCLGSDQTVDAAMIDAVGEEIVTAVKDGRLDESRLLDAADRVARMRVPVAAKQGTPDRRLAADAARRAIAVEGDLGATRGAVVATLDTAPGVAAGAVPWGPARCWSTYDPTASTVDVRGGDAVDRVLGEAAGRPLVAVTRDARVAWVRESLSAMASLRPDLVVVDMGWPAPDRPDDPRAAAYVRTYGASRASSDAVAALLADR